MKKDKHDPFATLRIKEFKFYLANRFFLTMGIQMQSVIVGWQVYDLTHDVLALGMIGLAEAIPFIAVSFFSGHVADTFNRKRIVLLFSFFYILVTASLLWFSLDVESMFANYGTMPIFGMIMLVGIIRGFLSAALPSLMAQIVPRELFANAATWNSTVWHTASILGPSIAGFVIAINYASAYAIDISFIIVSFIAIFFVRARPIPEKVHGESLTKSLTSGIRFVFKNQLLLGALTLDLFAVLFGGAIALLPAFADEVLHAGAVEVGFLRAAPALGAVIMAFIIAYRPPTNHAGRNLLLAVGAFGVTTILFGFTTSFYTAFLCLFLTGAFDNVSVVIRHTVLQLATPDNMRGRVSAVNGIFIGSSNEIGAFESGATARAFGLKPSIILGGVLTIMVVLLTARLAPKLRKMNLNHL
jgi:MFS family permease